MAGASSGSVAMQLTFGPFVKAADLDSHSVCGGMGTGT